jgi:hypothetical protein
MTSDEYIEGAAQVLLGAMDAVPEIQESRGVERAERIRGLAWALMHAAMLLRRAADIEEGNEGGRFT